MKISVFLNMMPHHTTPYNTAKDSAYLSGISVRINSSGEESYCFWNGGNIYRNMQLE